MTFGRITAPFEAPRIVPHVEGHSILGGVAPGNVHTSIQERSALWGSGEVVGRVSSLSAPAPAAKKLSAKLEMPSGLPKQSHVPSSTLTKQAFVFDSYASVGVLDAPALFAPRGVLASRSGGSAAVAFARTVVASPWIPPQAKVPLLLGAGAFALADLIQSYQFHQTTLVLGNKRLGPPSDLTRGETLIFPESENIDRSVPRQNQLDINDLVAPPEGRLALDGSRELEVHLGGAPKQDQSHKLPGLGALSPPRKDDYLLWNESSGDRVNRVPQRPDGVPAVNHRNLESKIQLLVGADTEHDNELYYHPTIATAEGGNGAVDDLSNLSPDNYGMVSAYNVTKRELGIELPGVNGSNQAAVNDAQFVHAMLNVIGKNHGAYPQAVNVSLEAWRQGERSADFDELIKRSAKPTDTSDPLAVQRGASDLAGEIASHPITSLLRSKGYEFKKYSSDFGNSVEWTLRKSL